MGVPVRVPTPALVPVLGRDDILGMKPNPISVAAALLLTACATEFQDEMPGRAQPPPPAPVQAGAPVAGILYAQNPYAQNPYGQNTQLKTLRQLQDEANGQSIFPPPPAQGGRVPRDQQAQQQNPQQPPVRRQGSSSPPPPPVALQQPPSLPAPLSTEPLTNSATRDLLSPEVDRLRNEDALGRLDPLQQRELFRKEQQLRQYGTGPLGY